jgi:hypothetical protein
MSYDANKCNCKDATDSTCHERLDARCGLECQSYNEAVLSKFFAAYKSSHKTNILSTIPIPCINWKIKAIAGLTRKEKMAGDNIIWSNWVKTELNDNKQKPSTGGKYSLELQYSWSASKVCFVLIPPLVLSLAIGIWYMVHTGDVVGAWTIALYIVATATGEAMVTFVRI